VPTTGAEVLVAQLEALGVEVVFGLPGVHNLAIFDALSRSTIRTILVRHEQTAAYAADGYARATGRLGVCVTTTGPGAANTAAAMGEAKASRSPVLHLSTQIESRLLAGRGGRWSLHESSHQKDLMAAVARWGASVSRAEAIASMVQRAAHQAFADRRGPAFLEIPHDFLGQNVRWQAGEPVRERALPADPDVVGRAGGALAEAKRPVIWAGGGVVSAGAWEVLGQVAESLQAPVVTTFSAKGVLPPDHPLLVGLPPHQPEVTKLLAGSDAALIVGSDLDGMNTQGWRITFPRPRIAINTVVEDCRRNYAADIVIEADAREALELLLPTLKPRRGGAGARRVAAARDAAERALRAEKGFAAGYRFVRRIEKSLPEGVAVFVDMAVPGYWMAAYHRARAPRSFAYPLGWGTLGFAFPAAIGAAAAGRRTLVVCGDAGLMYAVGDLATAVQERLPISVLCLNDEGYGMLRFDERERFGRTIASDLFTPDLPALARSFGIRARSATVAKVGEAVAWAMSKAGPALVEVRGKLEPPLTTSPRWPLKGRKEARP
jgi:acetolactate synthase-1/2/3 large subunit